MITFTSGIPRRRRESFGGARTFNLAPWKDQRTACGNRSKPRTERPRSYEWPNCDEKWLVVYAGADALADCAPIIEQSQSALQLDNFDRAYFWDKFLEKIYQTAFSIITVFDCPNIYVRRLPEYLRVASDNKQS